MDNNKFIKIIRFNQNGNDFINVVLPFYLISELSEVREYAKHPDGYQRSPNKAHYLKVKSYVIKNINDYKFPTSIILGADNDSFLKNFLKNDNCGEYLDFSNSNSQKIFRIVDGQHRIEGLKVAMKENEDIKNLMLSAVIVLTKENKKSSELEIFTQINSTAKRISTDLAELAKHSYQLKENKIIESDIIMFISMEAAYKLKEKGVTSVWNAGIKFDIHSEVSLGIVGVTMFCESIKNVVENFIDKGLVKKYLSENKKDDLIIYCKNISDNISDVLNDLWNNIIEPKWKNCFKSDVLKNEFGELVDVQYSKSYYIQNTLGVKALNVIFSECLSEFKDIDNAISAYKNIITNSKVTTSDWMKGGSFSGLSSESGFSKVRKIIKNEIPVPSN